MIGDGTTRVGGLPWTALAGIDGAGGTSLAPLGGGLALCAGFGGAIATLDLDARLGSRVRVCVVSSPSELCGKIVE